MSGIASLRANAATRGNAIPLTDQGALDIRALIGGDGDILDALRLARSADLDAWLADGAYVMTAAFDQRDMKIGASSNAHVSAAGKDRRMFFSSGRFTQIAPLAADLRKDTRVITFAGPHGLEAGDWIVIYNPTDYSWHDSRYYYRAGEWCQIASARHRSVKLRAPLRADYASKDVIPYQVGLRHPALSGGNWDCQDQMLVDYTGCSGPLVNVASVKARANTVINIDRCVSARIRCGYGYNDGSGHDDYLIAIGNSQNIHVSGDELFSRRHPVAIGGGDLVCGVPTRDCRVTDAKLLNQLSTNVMCADIHGCVQNSGYENCIIMGGGSISGADSFYRSCEIHARQDGNLIETSEFVGGNIEIGNVKMFSSAEQVGGGRGLIDFGSQNRSVNSATRMNVTLRLTKFTINAPQLARDEAIIRLHNNGSTVRINIFAEHGKLNIPNPVQFLRTELVSGRDKSDYIILSDISGLPQGSRAHVSVGDSYLRGKRTLSISE